MAFSAQADLPETATDLFLKTRARTAALVAPISPEDMMLQSMTDASPAKWHLAHTTWFFEEFILQPKMPGYRSPDDRFAFLFNSYYVQAGPRHARDKRGLISRPDIDAVFSYRRHVEEALLNLLETGANDDGTIADLVTLGCHHEMQHQELLLTDLLHAFSYNPLLPAYSACDRQTSYGEEPLSFTAHVGGLMEIGHSGPGFAFDCETPRHRTYAAPFEIADRPVTNREWIDFIDDGGYENPVHWLSDGFAHQQQQHWNHPLYWWQQEGSWWTFTLAGAKPVDLDAPVVHVSYYEADAYARWAGARLPTEAEHEIASRNKPIAGNFLESGLFRPSANGGFWGDVWQWTQSAYSAYPGFRATEGAIGEYNGKFMVNQFVLRGGSCVTPREQMRSTYRNFFYPHQRWQMMGLRLARDD